MDVVDLVLLGEVAVDIVDLVDVQGVGVLGGGVGGLGLVVGDVLMDVVSHWVIIIAKVATKIQMKVGECPCISP